MDSTFTEEDVSASWLTDSENENVENDSSNCTTPPKKKLQLNKHRAQKYRQIWEKDPDFRGWL